MDKFYCNVDIKKFGDVEARNAAGHNLRQIPSENIDPSRSHLNKFYVGSPTMNFDQELATQLKRFKVQKNAVKTVNLVFSASHDFFNDKKKGELWEKQTFEFISNTFGVENIIYAVVHNDEYTKHFQVSLLPVGPKGKLSATHFFDGRKKVHEFVSNYHKSVKNLGLLRDKGNKKAKPNDIRNFYNTVNEFAEYDKKMTETQEKIESQVINASPWAFIKTTTAKTLFQPLWDLVKRYKAKELKNRIEVQEAVLIKQENDDLKLKLED
ncbi:MobV family relaxase, partial [Duganella sp. Leaf61]|uniref:MobV family relaxase n=1 Tax=Duganella sp. Leaf61 TaxID=1736227 RepID=UPI000A71E101